MKAVRRDSCALAFGLWKLRENIESVTKAVKQDGLVLKSFSMKLRRKKLTSTADGKSVCFKLCMRKV